MKIISYLNKETNMYCVSINFVDYKAEIPKDEYEACTNEQEILYLMSKYSESTLKVQQEDAIDPSKAIVLPKFNGELPSTYLEYMSCLSFLFKEDYPDYKYVTVAYTGKIGIHKSCPRLVDNDYWDSAQSTFIGYLNEAFLFESEDVCDNFYRVDEV